MSIIPLPLEHDTSYPPARGPALLLSCMDLRLMDEIARFMSHDGLTNQYDHVIMAGAAIGALGAGKPDREHWRQTFDDHLKAAYSLHHFRDVYILEHRDCGAYRVYLGNDGDFGDSKTEQKKEAACHYKYANKLRLNILQWAQGKKPEIRVKLFLMDLRGRVSLLDRP